MSETFKLIEPLSQENAELIANQWHYPGEYSFYDMQNNQDYHDEFISNDYRDDNYFQVLNAKNELTAFFSIESDDQGYADIQLGMDPALINHGYGLSLMQLIEEYVKSSTNFGGMVLSVATFNQRAIKVFKRAGFKVIILGLADSFNDAYEFFKLFKRIVK